VLCDNIFTKFEDRTTAISSVVAHFLSWHYVTIMYMYIHCVTSTFDFLTSKLVLEFHVTLTIFSFNFGLFSPFQSSVRDTCSLYEIDGRKDRQTGKLGKLGTIILSVITTALTAQHRAQLRHLCGVTVL